MNNQTDQSNDIRKYMQPITEVMPDDFKDWHWGDPLEWAAIAARAIVSLREREALAWDYGPLSTVKSRWRAMERAPKDGISIIVTDDVITDIVEWDDHFGNWWSANLDGQFCKPTKWMHLPDPDEGPVPNVRAEALGVANVRAEALGEALGVARKHCPLIPHDGPVDAIQEAEYSTAGLIIQDIEALIDQAPAPVSADRYEVKHLILEWVHEVLRSYEVDSEAFKSDPELFECIGPLLDQISAIAQPTVKTDAEEIAKQVYDDLVKAINGWDNVIAMTRRKGDTPRGISE